MQYRFLFLFTVLFSLNASANTCGAKITFDEFKSVIDTTQARYLPELENVKIDLKFFDSPGYFLQAQPNRATLTRNKNERTYEVQINPSLLDCPPPQNALVSILVHELTHVTDYQKMSTARLIRFGIAYSLDRKFHARYERETDLRALEKGVGEGLIDYRLWIYPQLNSRQLAQKKRYYLTPEEILNWMAHSN